MASKIEDFLKIPIKKKQKKTVTVEIQGQRFDFDIMEIEPKLISQISTANAITIPSVIEGGPTTEGADQMQLALDVAEQAIVGPDLLDVELQEHFHVYNARDLLYEMFKKDFDSLGIILEEVMKISLNTEDKPERRGADPEDVNKAKN